MKSNQYSIDIDTLDGMSATHVVTLDCALTVRDVQQPLEGLNRSQISMSVTDAKKLHGWLGAYLAQLPSRS